MARSDAISVNGKWLSHPVTGTERYASEIVRIWVAEHGDRVELLVPEDAVLPEWTRGSTIRRSRFRGQIFEQLILPVLSRGRMLVCMGGPAPLLKRRQTVVLHDAGAFRLPRSYSRAFGTWYRVLYSVLARSARHVCTVSAFSAEELASAVHRPRAQFVLAPCGWQHMLRVEARRPENAEIPNEFAMFLGTPAPHKNVRRTLQAFAGAGITCVVVGGLTRPDVFGLDEDALPAHRVLLLGRLPDDEVAWLLQRATALVFPSFYEGFGLPILEAQSEGCPVIASNAASLPEVAGEGAVFFDPRDPEAALPLYEHLRDREARARLVERGRRNLERFSWEASAAVLARTAGLTRPGRSEA
jgi:glycosyltransferase involved in cell wall biosynthesis